jgi:hypothetical protein
MDENLLQKTIDALDNLGYVYVGVNPTHGYPLVNFYFKNDKNNIHCRSINAILEYNITQPE